MRYLRRVEGVTRMDRLINEDIRRRLEVEAVLEMADRKEEWRKKIEEMAQERLARRVFEEEVCGKRPKGGQERDGEMTLNDFAYILLCRTVYIPIETENLKYFYRM